MPLPAPVTIATLPPRLSSSRLNPADGGLEVLSPFGLASVRTRDVAER
jgi:hypothetical protein